MIKDACYKLHKLESANIDYAASTTSATLGEGRVGGAAWLMQCAGVRVIHGCTVNCCTYLKNSLENNVAFFHASLAGFSKTKSIFCEVSCETEGQASFSVLVIWLFIPRVAIGDRPNQPALNTSVHHTSHTTAHSGSLRRRFRTINYLSALNWDLVQHDIKDVSTSTIRRRD